MLRLDLSAVFKARGITRPHAFLVRAGTSNATAHKLVSGKHRILSLNHLEWLCIILNCAPHDLLVWEPGEGQAPDGPLAFLKADEEHGLEWVAQLREMPVDKLREVGKKLREMGE